MTPFQNPQNANQERYNISHMKTRNVIERTFGVLKMRFRCLHSTGGKLRISPKRACYVIIACCILHNIARKHNFYGEIYTDFPLAESTTESNPLNDDIRARDIRANILFNNFNS